MLAGGLGTRLRGVVDGMPKAMAPVAGRPFLAWLLDALAEQGMRQVVLATGYLGEQIETVLGTTWHSMSLVHSRESMPLGTGGAIALAMKHVVGDACFVLNGDTWLDIDYAAFDMAARRRGTRMGVALAAVQDIARYGVVRLDHGCIAGFDEKRGDGAGLVNAGTYWLERSLLTKWPANTAFSFERDVLLPAVARESVLGYTETNDFIDIGVPDDYRRAQRRFATRTGGTS